MKEEGRKLRDMISWNNEMWRKEWQIRS